MRNILQVISADGWWSVFGLSDGTIYRKRLCVWTLSEDRISREQSIEGTSGPFIGDSDESVNGHMGYIHESEWEFKQIPEREVIDEASVLFVSDLQED
jgi:hypothetical protein